MAGTNNTAVLTKVATASSPDTFAVSPSVLPSTSVPAVNSFSASTPSVFSAPTSQAPTVVVTSIPPTSTPVIVPSDTQPHTVLITSTQSPQRFPSDTSTHTATAAAATSKTGAAALSTSGASSGSNGGLSAGGKIAVAVVVPVVAVALILLALLFLWRRRKQRKEEEDQRRKEVEEYGFNPNKDPTLPTIGGTSSNGDEGEMTQTDGGGYRGWGTTSTARKPSTTLSSGNGGIGIARSTSNSDNGRYGNTSPTAATNKSSDVQSHDPLVANAQNHRPTTADSETIGALGAVPSQDNKQSMKRGPSNASSAYSGAHRSEASADVNMPSNAPNQQYYTDGMYFDDGMPQHGPYGDGTYGGGQPVIRDVPARRNTRIENPSVFPAQGSSGIAQNF